MPGLLLIVWEIPVDAIPARRLVKIKVLRFKNIILECSKKGHLGAVFRFVYLQLLTKIRAVSGLELVFRLRETAAAWKYEDNDNNEMLNRISSGWNKSW